ncbi:MAG: hypothetical protein PHI45_01960 [Candidatus Pacebacteria bacterium]|nr:hypothetical protein [Candidatus Paceibacterota bacterium]MDD5012775.1 hypothetical protein [Candidatus Paceibacterota bacterium]MDD5752825.1 hypothetical protein [Candidatus Paceibacterota bacterium]
MHPEEVKIEHQGSIWKGVTFLNENRVILRPEQGGAKRLLYDYIERQILLEYYKEC